MYCDAVTADEIAPEIFHNSESRLVISLKIF